MFLKGTFLIEKFDKELDLWFLECIADLDMEIKVGNKLLFTPFFQTFFILEIFNLSKKKDHVFVLCDQYHKYRLTLY